MIRIIYRKLDKSELIDKAVHERLESVIARFPDLERSKIAVTLEMLNSPIQPGPELYKVKVHFRSGRYKNMILEKSSWNLYVALADVIEHLLERLNRFGDKDRVKRIKRERSVHSLLYNSGGNYEKTGA